MNPHNNPDKNSDEQTFWRVIVSTLLAYLFGLILLSAASGDGITLAAMRPLAQGIVVGVAVAVVGGLLGFLFGISRSFQPQAAGRTENNKPASPTKKTRATGNSSRPNQSGTADESAPNRRSDISSTNNNLVEVSDWLTKIVVGVGLVQLNDIVVWLGEVGNKIGQGAGLTEPVGTSFGVAIILLNFGVGFLVTYIYARTFLTVLFAKVPGQIAEELEYKISKIEEVQKSQEKRTAGLREVATKAAMAFGGPPAVLAQLYQDPPEGFEEAIKMADALLQKPEHADNSDLWGYLACGLGQQFEYYTEHDRPVEELTQTADRAYEAVKKALLLNPLNKRWLRGLWDPHALNYSDSEADLVSLWQDLSQRERFAELLQ